MAIIFTGWDYTNMSNDYGPGDGNWPNGNTSVLEGDLMLFWTVLPIGDMSVISEPPILNLLETWDEGRIRMYWKIADAADESNSEPERYEFQLGPAYTGGFSYREMPVVQCSWSGAYQLNPLGEYAINDDSDIAPSIPDAREDDRLVSFHVLIFDREATTSYLPATPAGMTYRANGWGDTTLSGPPYVTTDWHVTIYDQLIAADGDTGTREATLGGIIHGVSGAILLNGSAPASLTRASVRPPGDLFSYIPRS